MGIFDDSQICKKAPVIIILKKKGKKNPRLTGKVSSVCKKGDDKQK